jgi:hypothetical protein
MNLSELKKMGISESFLRKAYSDNRQTFAWKANPTKENSPILFDTSGLEEYRLQQIIIEKKSRIRQGVC